MTYNEYPMVFGSSEWWYSEKLNSMRKKKNKVDDDSYKHSINDTLKKMNIHPNRLFFINFIATCNYENSQGCK